MPNTDETPDCERGLLAVLVLLRMLQGCPPPLPPRQPSPFHIIRLGEREAQVVHELLLNHA